MAEYLIQKETLDDIADAIRTKTGENGTMTPAQMPGKINSISTKEDLTWHQCPETPKEFIADVQTNHAYNSSNRDDVTYISKYVLTDPTEQEAEANTRPIPKVIAGVSYTDNEPLKATPFATESKAGTLTFLDKLRWYKTTRANGTHYKLGTNCRDLGGWSCDSGTVKYGWLIRSGELNPVDKDLMVNKIGVKTEVCFLPLADQQFPTVSPWGIDRVINWTNDDFQYRLYNSEDRPTIHAQWEAYLQGVIRSVNHSKPVIFHCGAGADKTETMALMLLGILGVSEQDIDIDYELTAFTYGIYAYPRTRMLGAYVYYKHMIDEFPLASGLTNSFRNRCISFVLSCGVTIDEINAFRANVIDGTPEPIQVDNTVTNTLSHCSTNNDDTYVARGGSYAAIITPDRGYTISSLSVTMGGVDVTSSSVIGDNIHIANVTGDIVIVAVGTTYTAVNLLDTIGYFDNTRVSLGHATAWKRMAAAGECTTGPIPIQVGDVIRAKGFTFSTLHYCIAAFFPSSDGLNGVGTNNMQTPGVYNAQGNDVVIDEDNNLTIKINTTAYSYMEFSGVCADGSSAFVTKNESLPYLYSVSNVLSNVSTSNTASRAQHGASYSATLTPTDSGTLSNVLVTMGGVNITSTAVSGGTVSIANVTGDIVISASSTTPAHNILDDVGYYNDTRISLSQSTAWNRASASGQCATGPIPIARGDVIRAKGFTFNNDTAGIVCFFNNAQGTGGEGRNMMIAGNTYVTQGNEIVISSDNIMTLTINTLTYTYVDFSGGCANGANAFVTKNELLPE